MSEPTRRVFFALWPEEAVRAALAHATHKVVRASGGRPVPADNLHATLLFLGSVAESRIADLVTVAARAVSHPDTRAALSAFTPEFIFDRIDLWTRAHVLVATTSLSASSAHTLAQILAGVLQRETSALGFAPDLKPFRPHITLARKVHHPPRFTKTEPITWPFTQFALVDSKTFPEGSVYTVLKSFPFNPPSSTTP